MSEIFIYHDKPQGEEDVTSMDRERKSEIIYNKNQSISIKERYNLLK